MSEWVSEVTQLCPTLCDPMDCSLPGSSVHGISQARVLEWVAISFSRGPSRPRDRTQVSRIVGRRFTLWATREVTALITVVVVQLLSRVQLFVTPWMAGCQASLSFMIFQSLCKFMTIESVMQSSHLILCCPLLLLPAIFPSIRDFSNESSVCIRWTKYWRFSISPFSEYSGLISFRIDWFDLLAVQGTLKSLLQHHNIKASIFRCSASLWSTSHIYTWLHDYCSFIIHFDVGTHKPVTLSFFFHFGVGSSETFVFPKKLLDHFLDVQKIPCWDFDWGFVKFIQLGKADVLTIGSLPLHEYRLSFHLFVSSLIPIIRILAFSIWIFYICC